MEIEWFRDLSITVMGFAMALASIVIMIVLVRLQRNANSALKEFKTAAILTRDTAAMVHDGVEPVVSVLRIFKGARRPEGRSPDDRKGRR